MQNYIKKALEYLENARIADYFDEMDKVELPNFQLKADYARLRGIFIAGAAPWDFHQQLHAFAKQVLRETDKPKTSDDTNEHSNQSQAQESNTKSQSSRDASEPLEYREDLPKTALFLVVSDFHHCHELHDLPSARRNAEALAAIARESGVQVRELVINKTASEMKKAVFEAAKNSSGVLLIYYAGHGIATESQGVRKFYFTAADSAVVNIAATGFSPEELSACINSAEKPRLQIALIIDCCFSARALDGFEKNAFYVCASAKPNETAKYPLDEEYSAFSGNLIKLLQNGIPGKGDRLTLNNLFSVVPNGGVIDKNRVGDIPIFTNKKFSPDALDCSFCFMPDEIRKVLRQTLVEKRSVQYYHPDAKLRERFISDMRNLAFGADAAALHVLDMSACRRNFELFLSECVREFDFSERPKNMREVKEMLEKQHKKDGIFRLLLLKSFDTLREEGTDGAYNSLFFECVRTLRNNLAFSLVIFAKVGNTDYRIAEMMSKLEVDAVALRNPETEDFAEESARRKKRNPLFEQIPDTVLNLWHTELLTDANAYALYDAVEINLAGRKAPDLETLKRKTDEARRLL